MKRLHFATLSIKVWASLMIVLMTGTVLLVITLSDVAPKVNAIPQLFSKDPMNFGQLVEVTNFNTQVKEKALIDEMLVRFYIENRVNYIPDISELSYRYGEMGPIRRLSSPGVYGEFLAQIGNFAEGVSAESATRSADIIQVRRTDNNFTVDFDVYAFNKGIISFMGRRRATVRIDYSPAYRGFMSDFVNPYGLIVVSYRETGVKK